MGIPGFTRLKCYAKGLRYIRPNKHSLRPHAIGIDLNQILHASLNDKQVKTKSGFLKAISSRVAAVTDAFPKTKHVGIFVDGPPPHAKLDLMKKRRTKSINIQNGRSTLYSPVHLTPGSRLLDEIEYFIKNMFPKIHLKSHHENGEGELALTNWIRHTCTKSDTALLYGGDADLILLGAAALQDVGDIFVLPAIPIAASKKVPIINPLQVLRAYPSISAADFTAVSSLFLGNDYLKPLVRSISQFEQTLEFLSGQKQGRNCKNGLNLVQDDGTLSTQTMVEICKHLNESYNFNFDGRPLVSDAACENYLKAVTWTVAMYSESAVPCHTYAYYGPTPSLVQIQDYCERRKCSIEIPKSENECLTCDETMLLVIPRWHEDVLPLRLRKAFHRGSSIEQLFPPKCETCMEFSKQLSKLNTKIRFSNSHNNNGKIIAVIRNTETKYMHHRMKEHPQTPPPVKEIRAWLKAAAS